MGKRLAKSTSSQEENVGVEIYKFFGKITLGCSVGSFVLLLVVSTLPQDYEKYNIPLFFGVWLLISLIVFAWGLVILILCKKSKKFQVWAEKDVLSFVERQIKKEIQRDKKKHNKQRR